jgi:hypothetical protein
VPGVVLLMSDLSQGDSPPAALVADGERAPERSA